MCSVLTQESWRDRILGKTGTATVPTNTTWIATGNNPEFSNEMMRRLVRIRLAPQTDRPWQRSGFRHPDLIAWVRANRLQHYEMPPADLPLLPAIRDFVANLA